MTLMQLLLASGEKTLTYTNTSSATGTTISYPSGILEGDVGLLIQASINIDETEPVDVQSAPSSVVPSGWNLRFTGTDTASISTPSDPENPGILLSSYAGRVSISSRIMTGGESGSLTGMSGNTNLKRIIILRPNWTVTSVGDFSNTVKLDLGNLSSQTVSAGTGPAISCGWVLSPGNNTLSYSGPNTEILLGNNSQRVVGITIFNQGSFASSSWNPGDGGNYNLFGSTGITIT